MAVISAIDLLVFSLMWIYYWKVGYVSTRSEMIKRESEPKAYRLAMLGFLIVNLAFLVSLIWCFSMLFRHAT